MQGDFDGDGKMDLATYNLTTAVWTVTESTRDGLTFTLGTPKSSTYPGSMPVVGNFDGPGASEFGVFDIVNGQGAVDRHHPDQGLRTVTFAQATTGDIPVPGDYDGVGYDQFAVYRPSTGQFLVLQAGGTVETITIPGLTPNANLVPVPAQYDNAYYFGQGQAYKTEAAVFDPATGVFTIASPSSATGTYTVTFQAGDIPVSADYAGTGSIQAAVFRPGTMQFIEKSQGTTGPDTVIATFSNLRLDVERPGDRPAVLPDPQQLRPVNGNRSDADAHSDPDADADTRRRRPLRPRHRRRRRPRHRRRRRPRHHRSSHRRCRSPRGVPSWSTASITSAVSSRGSPGRPLRATTIDLILSGTHVIGSKVVGTVVADAAGNYKFQLPAGLKKGGAYTLVARAHGMYGLADKVSTPISFKAGPAPHVKAPKAHPKAPTSRRLRPGPSSGSSRTPCTLLRSTPPRSRTDTSSTMPSRHSSRTAFLSRRRGFDTRSGTSRIA